MSLFIYLHNHFADTICKKIEDDGKLFYKITLT